MTNYRYVASLNPWKIPHICLIEYFQNPSHLPHWILGNSQYLFEFSWQGIPITTKTISCHKGFGVDGQKIKLRRFWQKSRWIMTWPREVSWDDFIVRCCVNKAEDRATVSESTLSPAAVLHHHIWFFCFSQPGLKGPKKTELYYCHNLNRSYLAENWTQISCWEIVLWGRFLPVVGCWQDASSQFSLPFTRLCLTLRIFHTIWNMFEKPQKIFSTEGWHIFEYIPTIAP